MASTPQEQLRVAQTDLPGAQLSAMPTAQVFGRGVANVGEDVGLGLYAHAIREANQTAFMSADRQMSEAQTQLQVKISEMKGKEALGAPDFLQTEWQKAQANIADGLANDEQKQAFQRAATTRYEQLNRATQFHVSTEHAKYQDDETWAYLKQSQDNARLNAADPQAVQLEKSRQRAVLMDWAQRHGLGGYGQQETEGPMPAVSSPTATEFVNSLSPAERDAGRIQEEADRGGSGLYAEGPRTMDKVWRGSPVFDQKWAEVQSATNTEVIKGLLYNGDDRSADAFYQIHKKEFTAADRDGVDKMLEEGSTRGESQRRVLALVADQKNMGEGLKAIDGIPDPKLQDATRARWKQHWADAKAAEALQQDQVYESAAKRIDDAIRSAKPGQVIDARAKIPEDEWVSLSQQERSALIAQGEHRAPESDRRNDDKKWLEFLALTPEQTAKMSPRVYQSTYRQYFDDATQNRADGRWSEAKAAVSKEDAKDPAVSATFAMSQQTISTFRNSGLVDAAKNPGKYSDEEMGMLSNFEREATRRIEETELANKKKLTATERQQVIDQVKDEAIKKVFVPGLMWDASKPAIALTEDEKGRAYVPVDKIPSKDLQDFKNYLLSNGIVPTPDKLRRIYAQYLLKNRAGIDAIMREK